MLPHVIAIAAWSAIAVIGYATLSRIGVVYNVYERVAPVFAGPSIATYVHFEHVCAYAAVGLLFTLAYPRSMLFVICIVFGSAVLLEVLQTLTPDRHGTVQDAIEKIAGGAVGIALGSASLSIKRWLQQRQNLPAR
jgi:VanZ family protein